MAMAHKAFVFDYSEFVRRLKDPLERALSNGDTTALVDLISSNLQSLRDPNEGTPLGPSWERGVESKDAHQYGDVALTLFYDPREDIGLGADWEALQAVLGREWKEEASPILGHTVGTFDPGKMGAYFQSANEVRENLRKLKELAPKRPELAPSIVMLQKAAGASKGLYVTF